MCCVCGHLEIAKWLNKICLNIKEIDKDTIIWSCGNGQLDIAKWLCSFNEINMIMWVKEIFIASYKKDI